MTDTHRVDVVHRLKHLVEVETDSLFLKPSPAIYEVKNISTGHQLENHVTDWDALTIWLNPHRVFLKCKHSNHVGMAQITVDFYFFSQRIQIIHFKDFDGNLRASLVSAKKDVTWFSIT